MLRRTQEGGRAPLRQILTGVSIWHLAKIGLRIWHFLSEFVVLAFPDKVIIWKLRNDRKSMKFNENQKLSIDLKVLLVPDRNYWESASR